MVLTGVFLSSLDLFIVNIAFPSISLNFHGESLSSLSWVLSAYTIVFAALLVPAGRWADRAGRKRAFLIGLGIFTALLGPLRAERRPSACSSPPAFSRPAAGPSCCPPRSACSSPPSGPTRKGAAIGLWSAVGGAAAALGPPIGGLLVQASWRWVFLVNLPFALLALVVGVRVLREVKDPDAHKADLVGAGLLSLAVASLVAAIVEGVRLGLDEPVHPGRLCRGRRLDGGAGGALAHAPQPDHRAGGDPAPGGGPGRRELVDLLRRLRRHGARVGVLFLTGVWHESVLRAGFMMAPGPLLAGLSAFPGGLLGARYSQRAVGTVGSLLFAASAAWWVTRIGATPDYAGAYLPGGR